jgi:transcription termination/antitermination protein NusA
MKANDLKGVNLVEVLKGVASGKNVEAEVIIDSLKEALRTAARKYLGLNKRIEVEIDPETTEITVLLQVQVVEDYPDVPDDADPAEVQKLDENYMLLPEAQEYNDEAQVGDVLEMEIPIEGFGRMAIQTAKQFLLQKVREAERKRIYDDYQGRIGTLISGVVQQVDRGNILINLGKTEAIMPVREQIRKERFRQGDGIQAYIADVSDMGKGAQVVLSRAHGQFLVELFKLEVPEIYDGIVEIRGVARDPGFRAKIAVTSRDDRIDPVGACVGMKGNRVQAIVRELSNERIDIVHWTDDMQAYLRRALAPCEILKVVEVTGTRRIVVVVADKDLSLAIGRNGQNVKLASQLLDRELDIFGEQEYSRLNPEERERLHKASQTDKPLNVQPEQKKEDRFSGLNALFKDSAEE